MATIAQENLLKGLMLREISVDDAHKSSLAAIVRRGWYDLEADIITTEGLYAAGIPTKEQRVLQLTQPYVYNGRRLDKGTSIMVLMAQRIGKYVVIDGYYAIGGKAVAIRLYKPASAVFTTVIMPDLEAMDGAS